MSGAAYIKETDDIGRDVLAVLARIERAMDSERASASKVRGRICSTCGGLTGRLPHCEVCRWNDLSYVIEEAEHLFGTDTPESIARRLGTNVDALTRRLHRAGRHDLARKFDPKEVAA